MTFLHFERNFAATANSAFSGTPSTSQFHRHAEKCCRLCASLPSSSTIQTTIVAESQLGHSSIWIISPLETQPMYSLPLSACWVTILPTIRLVWQSQNLRDMRICSSASTKPNESGERNQVLQLSHPPLLHFHCDLGPPPQSVSLLRAHQRPLTPFQSPAPAAIPLLLWRHLTVILYFTLFKLRREALRRLESPSQQGLTNVLERKVLISRQNAAD